MESLRECAYAKVNLYLHVVGRRDDGYHLLDSLAVFAGAHDVVEARPGREPGVTFDVEGRFADVLRDADPEANLVVRAARLLMQAGEGVALTLTKELPVASGIGGGSADAAAALRLLMRLRPDRVMPADALGALALSLGADVPVCVEQRAARMAGVGERLLPAPELPSCGIVLVNCGVAVSTPAVFRVRAPGFRPPASLPLSWADAGEMAHDLSRLVNDLQAPAMALCPQIATVLEAIGASPGCLMARMSGSGATCFGLFGSASEAQEAAGGIERPGWWSWGGALHSVT